MSWITDPLKLLLLYLIPESWYFPPSCTCTWEGIQGTYHFLFPRSDSYDLIHAVLLRTCMKFWGRAEQRRRVHIALGHNPECIQLSFRVNANCFWSSFLKMMGVGKENGFSRAVALYQVPEVTLGCFSKVSTSGPETTIESTAESMVIHHHPPWLLVLF